MPPGSFILFSVVLICILSAVAPMKSADDIFATPPNKSTIDPYPTAAAFLAATRSGEIPELLRDKHQLNFMKIGSSATNLLQKEYGLKHEHLYADGQVLFGVLLQNLTDYEFDEHNQQSVDSFRTNQNMLFGSPDDKVNRVFNDSRVAFNRFAVEYAKATNQYLASKHKDEEQRQTALAEEQRRADREKVKVSQEQMQAKEYTEAQAASLKAEEAVKASAEQEATAKQKSLRERRLKECLASPSYKLWEASLRVKEGEQMISRGQRVLDHDDAVKEESGVTDLAARRTAGEQIVAGKDLIESAFAVYKQLGGKATTASEVEPGIDPAKEFR